MLSSFLIMFIILNIIYSANRLIIIKNQFIIEHLMNLRLIYCKLNIIEWNVIILATTIKKNNLQYKNK